MNKRIIKNGAMDYHVLPPYGLLNDPNGLVHFKGLTHVFFQWNPLGTDHSYKAWGHAVTEDLVTYTYHEPALLPEESYERNGCYSGSALVHEDKLYLFYTGNVKNELGERESHQCVAVSEDGFQFEKLGPVISLVPGYTAHVRDPKVFQGENGIFYMVLGAQRTDLTGDTIVFTSRDLLAWDFQGSLMEERKTLGYMWECPDLVTLPDGDVFVFSPQGLEAEEFRFQNVFQTGYFTGTFRQGRFTPSGSPFEELDRGFEFYAPQTFQMPDGRTLLMGWMGTMEKEREEALPTIQDGWVHHLSIMRELEVRADGKLLQKPVQELYAYFEKTVTLEGKTLETYRKEAFLLEVSSAEVVQDFMLSVSSDVQIRLSEGNFRVERRDWAQGEWEIRQVPLPHGLKKMEVFGDGSSLEIFINGGEEVFSLRFFDESAEKKIHLTSLQKVSLQVSAFKKISEDYIQQ